MSKGNIFRRLSIQKPTSKARGARGTPPALMSHPTLRPASSHQLSFVSPVSLMASSCLSRYFLPCAPLFSLKRPSSRHHRHQWTASSLSVAAHHCFCSRSTLLSLTCKTFRHLTPVFIPSLRCALVPHVPSALMNFTPAGFPLGPCLYVVSPCYFLCLPCFSSVLPWSY